MSNQPWQPAGVVVKFAVFACVLVTLVSAWVGWSFHTANIIIQQEMPAPLLKLLESQAANAMHDIPANRTGVMYMTMQMIAVKEASALRSSLLITSVGLAFALMAFGIALFFMGYESAYQMRANQGGGGGGDANAWRLSLTASSPGLLCFVLATILIICGMLGRGYSRIETPGIDVSGISEVTSPAPGKPEPPPEIKPKVQK